MERHGLSQRRACRLVGMDRSTLRYRCKRVDYSTVRQRLRKLEHRTGRLVTDPRAAAELCIALQTARRVSSTDG